MPATLVLGSNGTLEKRLVARLQRLSHDRRMINMFHLNVDPQLRPTKTYMQSVIKSSAVDMLILITNDLPNFSPPQAIQADPFVGAVDWIESACQVWADQPTMARLHVVSTADVFGASADVDPLDEYSPYHPASPAAAMCAAIDQQAITTTKNFGIPLSISYPTTVIGHDQDMSGLVQNLIESALIGRRWPLYGDGSSIRDYIWVEDAVAAIAHAIELAQPGERFGIGLGFAATDHVFLGLLAQAVDTAFQQSPDLKLRFPRSPMAAGDPCIGLVTTVVDRRQAPRTARYQWRNAPWARGLPPGQPLRTVLHRLVTEVLAGYAKPVFNTVASASVGQDSRAILAH